ncbi:hypothetical protein EZI54_12030 [Marinobacter halodurans]|uniref:Uncharacterized protein n=1 Tax=Marinobacter halodurans TaxID=2528979 RepID=A0ABY1ZNC7_9GAMM|nr:hypothetical protein [Marinobacter halodurans]TBW55177.1 hypothetical protein EZI54_12030 [Marinobacter halodurans]
MLNSAVTRILIVLAISLFAIGSTLSHPSNLAVDQAVVSGFSMDMTGDLADDGPSPGDFFVFILTTGVIALVGLQQLAGNTPQPAKQAREVYYPVQPQGPPAQH